MEDAVTFLESAKKVYPDVTLLLNKIQLLALDKDPNQPFSDQVHQIMECTNIHGDGCLNNII